MKSKRTAVRLIFFLLLLSVLTACGKDKVPREGEPCIYYVNAGGTGRVKRAYSFADGAAEDEIKKVLGKMQEETDTIDYKSPFPKGLSVERWELHGTTLDLYFGEAYKEMNSTQELLLRAAVVQTLIQIDGVDEMCFFVGDKPLLDSEGRETGYMNGDDFVQNTGPGLHSYQQEDLRLYFANEKGDKLVAEDISVHYNSNTSKEKLIVERLLKGPDTKDAHPVLPAKTEILSVSTKNGVCYVNFSDQFLTAEYEMDPHLTIYAVVNSIVENGTAGQVQILVNGETDVMYQGSIDLSKPFSADSGYVEGKD